METSEHGDRAGRVRHGNKGTWRQGRESETWKQVDLETGRHGGT